MTAAEQQPTNDRRRVVLHASLLTLGVVGVSDPFLAAYNKLKEFVGEGHTQQEVTEFAQQLNRELPHDDDIATAMIKIRAIGAIVRELNGETDEQD